MSVNIRAQLLSSAVAELAAQSGVEITAPAPIMGQRASRGLQGQMTLRQALSSLLEGTGLTFHAAAPNVIAIEVDASASASGPRSVPGVSVEAQAIPLAGAAPGAPTGGASVSLSEVVVTATKRAQSVRDIPSTINVLTGKQLEQQGARQLKDFIDQVPGVKLQEGFNGPDEIAIRGIGPQSTPEVGLTGSSSNQTVGILYGDIPLTDPYSAFTSVDPDPWDLKDVEVLKGPQGTLFGASSEAGMIRYVPNTPVLESWEARGFAEWDSIKTGGTEPSFGAAVNVPLGRNLAFRASGVVEHTPGVVDIDTVNRNVQNADDVHKWQGRAMVLWQPLKRLTINAWWMDQQAHADELGFISLPGGQPNGQFTRNDAPDPSPSHRYFSLGTLDVRYAFNWATLVSLTGLQHKGSLTNADLTYDLPGEDFAQNGVSVLHALLNARANGIQQELRLVSPDGGHWQWLAGAFYSGYHGFAAQSLDATNTAALADIAGALPASLGGAFADAQGLSVQQNVYNPLTAREEALFGEVTRKLGPVDLTFGARFYRTDLDGALHTSGVLPTAENRSVDSVVNHSVDNDGFSPKFSIAYHATHNLMFYGTAAKGFQYGGVNLLVLNINNDPVTYKSSTLWSYEVGTRTDWFHRSLRFDLTGFYLKWKDAQIHENDAFPALDSYIDNVGVVVSRGFESSLRVLPPWIRGLSLDVTGSYDEAKTRVPFTAGGDTTPQNTLMPSSPYLQASATLAYARPLGPWQLRPALIYTHTNTSWNDIAHDELLPARDMYNLNFSLTRTDLPFRPAFSLVVDNLTDSRKVTQFSGGNSGSGAAILSAGGVNVPTVNYARPRTLELRVSADF